MELIDVFHDGKLCRDYPAVILKKRAQGILCIFFSSDEDITTCWFRRRHKSGKYEAIGCNFWILPENVVNDFRNELREFREDNLCN